MLTERPDFCTCESTMPITALRQRLHRSLNLAPEELPALLWAFAYFFCLLCSYYLLRPLRDAMGIAGGVDKLQWLFTATFMVMLVAVPVYGWAVARFRRARLLPMVYGFFVANLLLFFVLFRASAEYGTESGLENGAPYGIGFDIGYASLAQLFFVLLSLSPAVALVLVVQVLRRAGNYALMRPAREMLYTVLKRETKYKAKGFIDTAVYRGGDAVSAWAYAGMTSLGLGSAAIAAIAAPLSALWALVALGRHHRKLCEANVNQIDTAPQYAALTSSQGDRA